MPQILNGLFSFSHFSHIFIESILSLFIETNRQIIANS